MRSEAPNADIDGHQDADQNATAMALFADSQTAEWEPPAAPVTEALGLEVMEFVPPPSDADPLLGRSPELASAEQASTGKDGVHDFLPTRSKFARELSKSMAHSACRKIATSATGESLIRISSHTTRAQKN